MPTKTASRGVIEPPRQPAPPEFAFSPAAPADVRGIEVVAVPVLPGADGPELGPGAVAVAEDLLAAAEFAGASGKAGEVTPVPVAPTNANAALRLVLLIGVGQASPADLRRAGAALARATRGRDAVGSTLHCVTDDDRAISAFVEGAVLGSFTWTMRSAGPETLPVARVVLGLTEDRPELLARALAVAGAGWLARALSTVPSNIKNPPWLAEEAVRIAEAAGLKTKVWDDQALAEQGFGGLIGVGRGSATGPRLVQLDYSPARSGRVAGHVVLVGKGITFDTGGYSIKPGEAMVNMKRDMTGAAVVLAVLSALADVGCPIKVTGLLCLAENAISGDAMRPGDVITQYGGRTTEVTNTDAEGRLVLADGLAYAAAKLKPTVLVDIATLTGGIKVALGQRLGGLFATEDVLAAQFEAAGERAGEPFWRMPLSPLYQDKLASKVADADHCPPGAGAPPAIIAALFLQHFTAGLPWLHLDIASVGDAVEDAFEWTAGPTGFGARALLEWLAPAEG